MAALRDFSPLVTAQAALCPMPFVLNSVRWAVKKFLEDTLIWRCPLIKLDVVSGKGRYPLVTPPHSEAGAVLGVRYNGNRNLHPMPGDFWPDFPAEGEPDFWRYGHGILEVHPVPTTDLEAALEVSAALTINGSARYVPDWLEQDVIASGALSRILLQSGQPWFNAEMALYHQKEFSKAIAEERIKFLHGGTTGSLSIIAPPFGG